MGRFDWAGSGDFVISGTTDEEFKSFFNTMTNAQKNAIIADTAKESDDAEAKARAAAFIDRLGRLVLETLDTLV